MLTIPNSIKTLFKTDGTRKNFRVKFPNNELPDITNENIVRESVHFTESICSQSTFRFGLAEASVIEFETVGIGNMYGYTISCSYEIDTSSLSASEISNIQSDPGDGELVLASSSDIGFGFYRIPLGVFRVEKCPRNHGAMTHRQVTAYTSTSSTFMLSPIAESILAKGNSLSSYYFDPKAYISANAGYYNERILNSEYTKTIVATDSTTEQYSFATSFRVRPVGGFTTMTLSYQITGDMVKYSKALSTAEKNIYGARFGGMDCEQVSNFFADLLTRYVPSSSSQWNSMESLLYPYVRLPFAQSASTAAYGNVTIYQSGRDTAVFYPYLYPLNSSWDLRISAFKNLSVTVTVTSSGAVVETRTLSLSAPNTVEIYEYTEREVSPASMLSVPATSSYYPTGATKEYYRFTGAIDILALVNGYFEATGSFFVPERDGSFSEVELDPSSPLAISPGDYDECWWDEYDVSPIGTVTVTYRNGEEGEATANVTLGAGASLYDMTDNEVLKNLSTADLDSITTLLSGDFATNAENVGFTPIEMTMQGFPWLEAGDALQITAEDGTVVNTYALRVEMSGIQHLMSDITAEGGEIIGEV